MRGRGLPSHAGEKDGLIVVTRVEVPRTVTRRSKLVGEIGPVKFNHAIETARIILPPQSVAGQILGTPRAADRALFRRDGGAVDFHFDSPRRDGTCGLGGDPVACSR